MSNHLSIRRRHMVSRLTVHLVWATRERHPWLDPAIDARLSELLSLKSEELECRALAVGHGCDHVHVLVSYPPALAVVSIAHRLKGASSRILAGHLPEGFEWQAGYFAESIGDAAQAAGYVRRQREHHRDGAVGPREAWESIWHAAAGHR